MQPEYDAEFTYHPLSCCFLSPVNQDQIKMFAFIPVKKAIASVENTFNLTFLDKFQNIFQFNIEEFWLITINLRLNQFIYSLTDKTKMNVEEQLKERSILIIGCVPFCLRIHFCWMSVEDQNKVFWLYNPIGSRPNVCVLHFPFLNLLWFRNISFFGVLRKRSSTKCWTQFASYWQKYTIE